MSTRTVSLPEDPVKVNALQDAARIGIADPDRGTSRSFESITDLQNYLPNLSERIISRQ